MLFASCIECGTDPNNSCGCRFPAVVLSALGTMNQPRNGRQFVIYCWNIFSTIYFVQECLKRFGNSGDQFVLTYREKDEKETDAPI